MTQADYLLFLSRLTLISMISFQNFMEIWYVHLENNFYFVFFIFILYEYKMILTIFFSVGKTEVKIFA